MTTPRNDIVRLRLTTLEKQDWAKAAGGSRKLSEWIRSVCNEAAERDRHPLVTVTPLPAPGMTDLMISPEAIDEALAVPNEKPVMVKDAIEREIATLKPPVVPPPLPKGAQCDRWMHHRKGVYCGSCKRVTT